MVISDVDTFVEFVVRSRTSIDGPMMANGHVGNGNAANGTSTHEKSSLLKESSASNYDDRQVQLKAVKSCQKFVQTKSSSQPQLLKWDSTWMELYNELMTYKNNFGHCNACVDNEAHSKLGSLIQR